MAQAYQLSWFKHSRARGSCKHFYALNGIFLLRLSAQPCVMKEHHYTIKLVLAPESGTSALAEVLAKTLHILLQPPSARTTSTLPYLLLECKCFKESLEGTEQECMKQESNSHLRLCLHRPHPSHVPPPPQARGTVPTPPYLTRMKGLYVNSSAMVEGMVGSPLSYLA